METRKLKTPEELREEITGESRAAVQLSTTHHFTVNRMIRGRLFAGEFTFEVPTLADQIMIGQLKNKYLPGGGVADPPSAALVEYICYLEVTLKKKPSWWKPLEFTESDLLVEVYAEVVRYANRFLGRDSERGGADEGDEGEDDGGGHPGDEGDVDSSVSGPEQRSTLAVSHRSRS